MRLLPRFAGVSATGVAAAHSSLERNNEIHLGNKTRRMTVNRLSDPGFDGEILADRVESTKAGCPVLPVVRFKRVGVQDKFSMEQTERFVQAQYRGIVVPGLKSIATMQPQDLPNPAKERMAHPHEHVPRA